jgi:hypothetical protein
MNVYFTVDTESSMGGAWTHRDRRPLSADKHIFCRIGDRDHGIGLITRTFGEHGLRATFFVEPLVALVNGEADTQRVYDFLLEHRQDVQLHAHPTYRYFADMLKAPLAAVPSQGAVGCDLFSALDEASQMELLEQASELHRRLSGAAPVAFRAGCFASNHVTLRCLSRLGIVLDSSFNPCYRTWSFPQEDLRPNEVRRIEGVWELPVTVARTPLPEGHGGFKHADPCSLSFGELRTMLEQARDLGLEHFVFVFHSFSAVKPKDDVYSQMRPDRITSRRLARLAAYLAKHSSDYRVTTLGDLARNMSMLATGRSPIPTLPPLRAGVRKSVQALNRLYWF